ncbi:MAG: hypothetical protein AB7Q29_19610 [Vicinamibacterales bacterium]
MAIEILDGDQTVDVRETELRDIENADADVVYTIRKLDPTTHRAITKRHTKPEFVRGVGRVKEVDLDAVNDDLLDHILVGWSGVLLRGAPAPCERTLKLRGLDWQRKRALLDKAGANEIAREPERRAESFRAAAPSV